MNPEREEALELIRRHAEGVASGAETAELESLLRASPELVDLHVDYLLLDETLWSRTQENEGANARAGDRVVLLPRRTRKWPIAGWSLAAAAAVVLGLVAIWRHDSSGSVTVRIVDVDGAVLSGHAETLAVGRSINVAKILLDSGRLFVALESGVSLEMIAPFEGVLLDSMHLRLLRGRLNTDVGERGKGFTVSTDACDVVDLGTRFGIDADAGGESRVVVFTGEVEVRPRQAEGLLTKRSTVRMTEGQAAAFSVAAGLRQWREVALAAKAAGISSQPYAGVVAKIQDNMGGGAIRPYYGLVQGGMREGVMAYTDKPRPVWLASEGAEFPEFLNGSDLIRTYHQLRWRPDFRLSLKLRGAAEIYVLWDLRTEAPEWLRKDFENTGERLRVGPWHPTMAKQPGVVMKDNEPYLDIAVWRRAVEGGDVVLGAAQAADDDDQTIMYGIAVKDLHKPFR